MKLSQASKSSNLSVIGEMFSKVDVTVQQSCPLLRIHRLVQTLT